MLSLVVKKQTPTILAYFDPNKIIAKIGIAPITVHDNTRIAVEPFTYVDGGFYDAVGTPVDARYYNTTSWTETWDAGYP